MRLFWQTSFICFERRIREWNDAYNFDHDYFRRKVSPLLRGSMDLKEEGVFASMRFYQKFLRISFVKGAMYELYLLQKI